VEPYPKPVHLREGGVQLLKKYGFPADGFGIIQEGEYGGISPG
jgi:hypothetical protein